MLLPRENCAKSKYPLSQRPVGASSLTSREIIIRTRQNLVAEHSDQSLTPPSEFVFRPNIARRDVRDRNESDGRRCQNPVEKTRPSLEKRQIFQNENNPGRARLERGLETKGDKRQDGEQTNYFDSFMINGEAPERGGALGVSIIKLKR